MYLAAPRNTAADVYHPGGSPREGRRSQAPPDLEVADILRGRDISAGWLAGSLSRRQQAATGSDADGAAPQAEQSSSELSSSDVAHTRTQTHTGGSPPHGPPRETDASPAAHRRLHQEATPRGYVAAVAEDEAFYPIRGLADGCCTRGDDGKMAGREVGEKGG